MKNSSLIEPYLADKIIFHPGCEGENGADVVFEWPKQSFIDGNVLGIDFRTRSVSEISDDTIWSSSKCASIFRQK